MVWPSCCVPNCGENKLTLVRFPHPTSDSSCLFDAWVKLVGDPNLLYMDRMVIYDSKRICLRHFSRPSFIEGSSELRKDAFPNVHLPAAEGGEVESHPGPSEGEPSTLVVSSPPAERGEVEPQPGPSGLQTPHRSVIEENLTRSPSEGGVFDQVGIKKSIVLTPKARSLCKAYRFLMKSVLRSSKELCFKRRLKAAGSISHIGVGALDNLPPALTSFLHFQLAEYRKKSKGYRFPLDYKVWSLSLLKRSGRVYDYFSKLFVLPPQRTLIKFLSRLSFSTGINDAMFDHLSVTVEKKVKGRGRHCILMFDEMSLTPHLDFQDQLDLIEGFEDLGGGNRSQRFADRALVFMVRGLRRKFKQPVAYVFPAGSLKPLDFSQLINAVVIKLFDSGLKVRATVCGQGPANVAAINKLCAETRESVLGCGGEFRGEYFCVNDAKVIPLFDPLHMLRGIRNGLITEDLKFCQDGVDKIASWRHIRQVYAIGCGEKLLPGLTDYHVVPEKIKKMKVKCCTRVFSQRLAVVMRLMSEITRDIEPQGRDTADLLNFFDNLLDSVNGSLKRRSRAKPLLCAVTSSSRHMEFWSKAIELLQSMAFTDGRQDSKTPSITNWVRTLSNIQSLWLLLEGQWFESLRPRNLNQDPLENMFGCIRSYGFQNNSPTVANFVDAFKSLILNDMVVAHPVVTDREGDDCEVLDNLKSYLGVSESSSSSSSSPPVDIDEGGWEDADDQPGGNGASSSLGSTMEFTGLSAGDLLKKLGPVQCADCARKQCASETVSNFQGLMQPTKEFAEIYALATGLIYRHLPNMAHKLGVGSFLRSKLSQMIDFRFIACNVHHVSYGAHFCNYVVRATITTWCNSVNRYLSGKCTKRTKVMDIVHLLAWESFAKRKQRP